MQLDRPVVMIVDDQPLNLRHLAEVLDGDYRVKVAPSGRRALELVRRPPHPEVILLDVMMPEMDGYAVCAALKEDRTTADIPVIFITACTDVASERAALAAGAVDFLHKPINPEVVRARVRLHQELARHRHHLEELVHMRTLQLAQARDLAESASRFKTALLANLGHEMRTPLNHITGMAYLLRRDLPEVARAREQIGVIDKAARILLALVTDLIDLARLDAGDFTLEGRVFDPAELIGQTVEAHREAATAKGLRLCPSLDPAVPDRLVGDTRYLGRILAHIVDNAVKFSEQGEIALRVGLGEPQDDRLQVYFEVRDQGGGMEPELAERFFQVFRLGDESLTCKNGGLGIGLAFSHQLVTRMGGGIQLASAPGQGSTVTFWVPLEVAPSASGRP